MEVVREAGVTAGTAAAAVAVTRVGEIVEAATVEGIEAAVRASG
jgi:hypothetical protein